MYSNRDLFIILSGLFIVMAGLGITLPVLPFFIQRLSESQGVAPELVSFHVGLLTGIYALMQFLFSPVFGILSDRKGRKPFIIIGMAGYSLSLILFAIATNLWLFYLLRILGGIFSAAFLTGSIAYIADVTPLNKRAKGMALFGSFIGLGLVAGPFIGSFFTNTNIHFYFKWFDLTIDSYTIPFLLAGAFSIIVAAVLFFFLKEKLKYSKKKFDLASLNIKEFFSEHKLSLKDTFVFLLLLFFISQFSLAMFEGTFAIHSEKFPDFDLGKLSIIFAVCGGVMSILQIGPVPWLIGKKGEISLLPFGFIIMGIGMSMLMSTQSFGLILVYVTLISIGMALLTPSLASLVSKVSQKNFGVSLGIFSSVSSLAQAAGVLFGGIALIWYTHIAYWLTAVLLFAAAVLILIKQRKNNPLKIKI